MTNSEWFWWRWWWIFVQPRSEPRFVNFNSKFQQTSKSSRMTHCKCRFLFRSKDRVPSHNEQKFISTDSWNYFCVVVYEFQNIKEREIARERSKYRNRNRNKKKYSNLVLMMRIKSRAVKNIQFNLISSNLDLSHLSLSLIFGDIYFL